MKTFMNQLSFDGKRLVLRNPSYIFFTIIMPLFFYILFTKVFTVGNAYEMAFFNKSYLGSMIIYSVLINALFGFAQIMNSDRNQGFLSFLNLTYSGKLAYYFSLGFWMIMLSFFSILVMTIVAIFLNHVKLNLVQWLGLLLIPLIGEIPLLLIGLSISNIPRQENLGIVSNLITFPMAIISGLYWPINMLPTWLQGIGKLMPTYFSNNLLSKVLLQQKVDYTNFVGIIIWVIIGIILVVLINKLIRRRILVVGGA